MKNITKCIVPVSISFTCSMIIFMIISLLLKNESIEITTVLSILLISILGSLIQYIAFTNILIKKASYSIRLIIFVIPFLVVLTLCAICFNWFPKENIGSWITFMIIFIAIFIVMTIGFEIYFRIAGKKYDGLLGQYKKEREIKKK
ncbi:MAG: DUF3021 family protein [Clostridium sp.]|nr:DUF3021 family protein [Clostridium sp.]